MSLNEQRIANLYNWYDSLENRLMSILDVIPVTDPVTSLQVQTPSLAPILVESCSIIDSLFRTIFPPSAKLPSGKTVKRNDASIKSYYAILESRLNLKCTYSLFMSPVPIILHPFGKWTGKASPDWWKLYNILKHNRLSKPSDVSLANTVDCLCGLKQLMIKVSEVLARSMRFAWIDPTGYNVEHLVDILQNPSSSEKFLAYTKLFCTPVHPLKWLKEQDIQPGRFINGGRLMAYLGRMM